MSEARSAVPAEVPGPVYDSAHRPHPFVEEWIELIRFRDLVGQWTLRTIKLRYKRSVLGVLWTLLEPLSLMVILTIVFSTVFRFPVRNYPIYLLPGLLMWDFFSRTSLMIVDDIIASGSLAQRIHIPRSTFAAAAIGTFMFNWLISLLPLVAIMVYVQHPFSWAILSVPLGMLVVATFTLGVGLIVATFGAVFRDIHLTYQVLLTGLFYATPIFYPVTIIPESYRGLFRYNPVLALANLVREPFFAARVADSGDWIFGGATALTALLTGWWVFTRWRNVFDYRG